MYISFFIIVNSFFVKICVILYYNDVDKSHQIFFIVALEFICLVLLAPPPR